jgi:hypothetical protein
MKPKNKFSIFFEWLLEKLGIIKTYEISKEEMCKNARDICNKNCKMCAWNTEEYEPDDWDSLSNAERDH